MDRFSNRVALVTGAASGIGRACALRLAAEGASVFCVDLAEEPLLALVAEIESRGGTAAAHTCDVSSEESVCAAVATCVDQFERLDTLVNMAGILRFDDTGVLAHAQWQKVIDVNLTGTLS